MAAFRTVLLQVVRLEDPHACEPTCRALREGFPGSIITLPAEYHVARVGHLSGVDEVMVMEPGFWKQVRALRAQRFDAACVSYECPALPGPVRLEAMAMLCGSRGLLAASGAWLGDIARFRLALRIACGLGMAALCAIVGVALSLVLMPLLLLSRLLPAGAAKGWAQ